MKLGSLAAERDAVRHSLRASRQFVQIVYRDPEHASERLALAAQRRLGEPSLAWAEAELRRHPERDPGEIAARLRHETAAAARIDGAIAGTPFLVALVPGYIAYLWSEARLVLRTAALYGRDPRQPETAAELLALRGVHRTLEQAEQALRAVAQTPLPEKPVNRRSPRTWLRAVRAVLVLAGLISDSSERGPRRWRDRAMALAGMVAGLGTWVLTWIFPVTLMVIIAWTCERDCRRLASRAVAFYGPDTTATGQTRHSRPRASLRGGALALTVVVPVAFIAYADRVRQTTGVNAFSAAGALVAVALIIAVAVLSRRR